MGAPVSTPALSAAQRRTLRRVADAVEAGAVSAEWGPEYGSLRTLRALIVRGLVEAESRTTSAVVFDHRGCAFGRWNGSRVVTHRAFRVRLTTSGRAALEER